MPFLWCFPQCSAALFQKTRKKPWNQNKNCMGKWYHVSVKQYEFVFQNPTKWNNSLGLAWQRSHQFSLPWGLLWCRVFTRKYRFTLCSTILHITSLSKGGWQSLTHVMLKQATCYRSFPQFIYYFRSGVDVTVFSQLVPSHVPLLNLLRGLRKHQATSLKTLCGMLLLFLIWKICKKIFKKKVFLIFSEEYIL